MLFYLTLIQKKSANHFKNSKILRKTFIMADSNEIRENVLKLMKQKDGIESEIKELTAILNQNGVGMNDPLVDVEGFPNNNIDVYQVRHARHRIICLQTDHKNVMKQIENGLHGYYSSSANAGVVNTGSRDVEMHFVDAVVHKTPFAKVTIVSPGSPAEYSGIEVDDLIIEFGSVNANNFKSLTDIATVLQHSEGQQLSLKLQRGQRSVVTNLIPKKWTGKGLLGCNIVPV